MASGASASGRRFALLDRDGTVNEEIDHVAHPDDLKLIPGSIGAIRRLRALGLGVVVVTNQANVGRGLLTSETLASIHARLLEMLGEQGATVDAILHCPHAPEDACGCRKPSPGMAFEAARRFGFDLTEAFVVGDHARDVGLGRAVGATTFLVLTGHGADERVAVERDGLADHIVRDLADAADLIAELLGKDDG